MNNKIDSSLKLEIENIINLYKLKNFKSALNFCNILIKKKGNFPFLLNLNGIINLSLENWQNALLSFEKTLEEDKNFIEAYNNLGITYSHLGKYDKAVENYKKAIKLNKNYANAYNNIATHFDDFGNYTLATEYYKKALKCNPEHPNAKYNLVHLLNYHKIENPENNSIIKSNNQIQKISSNILLDNKILTSDVSIFIKKSIEIIKTNSININFPDSQIHRTNENNLNCDRHKKAFNKYNIIPKHCFSCFKVQIELNSVSQLIKLFFIFDQINFPKDNIRKCFVELRRNVKGNYKGLIYCSNIEEAKNASKLITEFLNKSIENFKIEIKRGCTEFDLSYPGYKDIKKVNEIIYDEMWKKKEELIDIEIANGSQKKRKYFSKSLNGVNLGDVLIINNWLTYAKIIGDKSYMEIAPDFIFSVNISNALGKS